MKERTARPEPALHEVQVARQALKLPEEVQALRQEQGLRAPVDILVGQVGPLQVLDKLVKTNSLLRSGAYVGYYPFNSLQLRRIRWRRGIWNWSERGFYKSSVREIFA